MATSRTPKIRNLRHTTLDELDLTDDELAEFHRTQAAVVDAILSDPVPGDDAFGH
ncbi:MAG: hypothetical protein WBM50_25550 [Acidimicrobiales bacterium]